MTIKVMVVDDHRIVREGLAYMLGAVEGIELVSEASSGAELLATFDEAEPDVVLLDVQMPEMSGLEALGQLKQRRPQARVIMLSMHDQVSYIQQAMRLGASGYTLKSVGLEELLHALHTVAEGGVYLQGELAASVMMPRSPDGPALSPRELDVLALVSAGLRNKQIARRLNISEETVKTHLKAIYTRLDVRSRAEATALALRLGLIE